MSAERILKKDFEYIEKVIPEIKWEVKEIIFKRVKFALIIKKLEQGSPPTQN